MNREREIWVVLRQRKKGLHFKAFFKKLFKKSNKKDRKSAIIKVVELFCW